MHVISPSRFAPASTEVDPDASIARDLVRRLSDTGVPNRVWTCDITYLGTGQAVSLRGAGRLFRRVIGCAMAVARRGELAD